MSEPYDEYDSSSDDSVCFGPYTLKEAKRDIRKCTPIAIKHRHSSISRFNHHDVSTETQAFTSRFEKPTNILLNPEIEAVTAQFGEATNISSNPSEYLTANETIPTQEAQESANSEFLEKLTKVINQPMSEASYSTAIDQSNIQEQNSRGSAELLEEESIISISDDSLCQELSADSIYDEYVDERESIKQEVVDLTDSLVIVDDDEEINCSGSIGQEVVKQEGSTEIKSDQIAESPREEFLYTKFDSIPPIPVEEIRLSLNQLNSPDIIPPSPVEEKPFGFNQLSKISEKSEFSTQESCEKHLSPNITEIKILESGSPLQLPEINLQQFDDSCDFDDTLEEMNRFLEQGTEYVMPNDATPSKTNFENISKREISPPFGKLTSNESPVPTKNLIKKFYSAEKISKPSVVVSGPKTVSKFKFHHTESRIKPPSVNVKPLFNKAAVKPTVEPAFKFPSKPAKKLTTPNKTSNLALKNVVSPVGIYINHTRKYVPMVNVRQVGPRSKIAPKINQPGPSSKENNHGALNMEIPPVIYRPAKTKQVSEVKEINLPNNIKKLVSPRVVIKHEQKINSEACNESIERRLLESDLSIDVSQLNRSETPDISVLSYNHPFNLRKF